MAKPLREFTQFIWWMQTQHRGGRQTTWDCESTAKGCCHPHPRSPFIIITQSESWYSFYRPTEGERLSRPRHCSKGVHGCISQWLSWPRWDWTLCSSVADVFCAVVRTKAINAKIDHPSRRVVVSRTIHRTFGKAQWHQLHDQLRDWQQNVSQVLSGFVNLQKSLQTQRWDLSPHWLMTDNVFTQTSDIYYNVVLCTTHISTELCNSSTLKLEV